MTWPQHTGEFRLGDFKTQSGETIRDAKLVWKSHAYVMLVGRQMARAAALVPPVVVTVTSYGVALSASPDGTTTVSLPSLTTVGVAVSVGPNFTVGVVMYVQGVVLFGRRRLYCGHAVGGGFVNGEEVDGVFCHRLWSDCTSLSGVYF